MFFPLKATFTSYFPKFSWNSLKLLEFSFSIAFQATDEGAYQNLLGIYLTSKREESDTITAFFMGAISIKSEVEGEDERFRTLLTDFSHFII